MDRLKLKDLKEFLNDDIWNLRNHFKNSATNDMHNINIVSGPGIKID